MAVEIARDWLDYVEAIGAGGSLILAGIAAWFAWRSAADSGRSAMAAEETAAAAADQAKLSRQLVERIEEQLEIERATRADLVRELRRKPSLAPPELTFQTTFPPDQLTMGTLMRMGIPLDIGRPVTEPHPVVLRARFVNEGDKAADQLLVTVSVPESVGLMPSGPQGDHPQTVDLHVVEGLELLAAGDPERAHQFGWRVPSMPPHQPETTFLTLLLRQESDYEVEVAAEHPDAEPVARRFMVSTAEVRMLESDTDA